MKSELYGRYYTTLTDMRLIDVQIRTIGGSNGMQWEEMGAVRAERRTA